MMLITLSAEDPELKLRNSRAQNGWQQTAFRD
jgi:hypothetical protein